MTENSNSARKRISASSLNQKKPITITCIESLSEAETEPFSRASLSADNSPDSDTDAIDPQPSADAAATSNTAHEEAEIVTDLTSIIAEIDQLDLPESDKITLRNVSKQYNCLAQWQHIINGIEDHELDMDELDNKKSSYIRESFYKKKFFRTYREMCMSIARKPHLKEFFVNEMDARERDVDSFDAILKFRRVKKIKFTMTRYDPLNKALEGLLNRPKDPVPDYHDVYDLVTKVNAESKLGLSDIKAEETAKAAFKACVDLFKKRRIKTNTEVMLTRLKSTDLESDPAKECKELDEKLVENKSESERKLDAIISEFAEKSAKDDVDDGEEESDDDEEDEEDDSVTIGSTNCASEVDEDEDDLSFEEIGSENIDDGFSGESRDVDEESRDSAALVKLLTGDKERNSEEERAETHDQFKKVMKMSPNTPKKGGDGDLKGVKRAKNEGEAATPDKKVRRSDEKKARMSESFNGDNDNNDEDDVIVLD